ncbi:MAG TPA: VOC family protein [Acidimicrobiales bacterium]|jgi:catechol 2,3-dioxygenase-like lactoylglutathione lyase family enzyme|nr:VOC family protein [Acidimicrobiales bacterium]
MRLTNVTVWTKDPHLLRDWYTEHLGMKVIEDTPRFVLVRGEGGAAIGFHVGDPLVTPDRVQFHLEVHDVDHEYQRLRAQGVDFEEPPTNRPWGVRSTAARDPAGHSVELTTTSVTGASS